MGVGSEPSPRWGLGRPALGREGEEDVLGNRGGERIEKKYK